MTATTKGCDPQLFLYAAACLARLSAVELQDMEQHPQKNKAAACYTKAKTEGVFEAAVGTFEHAMKASIQPVTSYVLYHAHHMPTVYLAAAQGAKTICNLASDTS